MGSVSRTCRDCGAIISGYWSVEVDGTAEENEGTLQEDFSEPFNLRLARLRHREECIPWRHWRGVLEEIAKCNRGEGYMPELAQKALNISPPRTRTGSGR